MIPRVATSAFAIGASLFLAAVGIVLFLWNRPESLVDSRIQPASGSLPDQSRKPSKGGPPEVNEPEAEVAPSQNLPRHELVTLPAHSARSTSEIQQATSFSPLTDMLVLTVSNIVPGSIKVEGSEVAGNLYLKLKNETSDQLETLRRRVRRVTFQGNVIADGLTVQRQNGSNAGIILVFHNRAEAEQVAAELQPENR